jgi:hypothetical protein
MLPKASGMFGYGKECGYKLNKSLKYVKDRNERYDS